MLYSPFVQGTGPGLDDLQLNFLNMYIEALDPRARAIMKMPNGSARYNACLALAASTGLLLDLNIVGEGWDPLFTMSFRQATCHYIWTPSCLQQTPQDPNVMSVGPVPAGAIKVSLDSADYPAFIPPGLPQPAPGVLWVGPNITGVLYNSTPAAKIQQASGNPFPAGDEYSETDAGGNLKRYIAQYPPNLPTWLTWLQQTP